LVKFSSASVNSFVLLSYNFREEQRQFLSEFRTNQCSITDNTGALTGGIGGTSLADVTVKVSFGSGGESFKLLGL
jgi:hypothetical protein